MGPDSGRGPGHPFRCASRPLAAGYPPVAATRVCSGRPRAGPPPVGPSCPARKPPIPGSFCFLHRWPVRPPHSCDPLGWVRVPTPKRCRILAITVVGEMPNIRPMLRMPHPSSRGGDPLVHAGRPCLVAVGGLVVAPAGFAVQYPAPARRPLLMQIPPQWWQVFIGLCCGPNVASCFAPHHRATICNTKGGRAPVRPEERLSAALGVLGHLVVPHRPAGRID